MTPTFLILSDAGGQIIDKWQGTLGESGDHPQQLAFPDISGEQFMNGYRLLPLLTSLPSFTLHQIGLILKISLGTCGMVFILLQKTCHTHTHTSTL